MHSTEEIINDAVLASYPASGAETLRTTLPVLSQEDLMRALSQYVHFNAAFAPGVPHLAGQVAARQDLFKDPTEQITSLADRSGEVAKHIFVAAVDEFGGPESAYPSHRTLAQDALKGVGRFFEYDLPTLCRLTECSKATRIACTNVTKGYGIGETMNEKELLNGIGFHLGSETLAGDEFRVIDAFLRTHYPELVAFMEEIHPDIADAQTYIWIQVHTVVEDEHAKHALHAANLALKYCAGTQDALTAKQEILNGFQHFANIQSDFIAHIVD